jgi:hypothetical protein
MPKKVAQAAFVGDLVFCHVRVSFSVVCATTVTKVGGAWCFPHVHFTNPSGILGAPLFGIGLWRSVGAAGNVSASHQSWRWRAMSP